MPKETITIKLPKNLRFTEDQFEQIKFRNQEVEIRKGRRGASLVLYEKDFLFCKVDFFEVKLSEGTLLSDEQFIALFEKNDNLKFETTSEDSIIINMNTTIIITAFTFLIGVSIGMWNYVQNKGWGGDATGSFFMKKTKKKLVPDISFTLFSKMVNDVINVKLYPQIAPTLCIEIVSNKSRRELEKNLAKMTDQWMPEGTDVGLVIDPFERTYYVFEKDQPEGCKIEFSSLFTHPLLPELALNFDELLDKGIGQFPGLKFPPE
jgi:Uma2 family endonuclease